MANFDAAEGAPPDPEDPSRDYPGLGPGHWPAPRSLPIARPGLSAVPLDDNVAIYDEVGHVLVMLNSSAAAVLEWCDGATTFETIVEQLAEDHRADEETVREDVRRTLRKLASIGLVADAR